MTGHRLPSQCLFYPALRRAAWLAAAALLLLAAGTLPLHAQAQELPNRTIPSIQSRFGIDYVFPLQQEYHDEKWARIFAATGAGWVNFAEISWSKIEPDPPVKGAHHYKWEELDSAVRMWQKQGFQIVLTLRILNGWFAGLVKYNPQGVAISHVFTRNSDRLPAGKHMDDYREWIKAIVERYDCDGTDDMKDLKYPILHFQVGNEYSNPMFWTGTFDDYRILLEETYKSAKKANPKVRIISNGIRWNDMFHNDPDGTEFDRRFKEFLKNLPSDSHRSVWRRAREFHEKTIELAEYYDILDAGGNGPYPTMSAGYCKWVKRELSKTGYTRTIWDMEARCEPNLTYSPITRFHKSLQVPKGNEILQALKRKGSPLHDRAEIWYRAEQARIVVKVYVTRFASGFEKVFMGMPDDWDRMMARFSTDNPYLGLTDSEGRPWPAFYAVKSLIRKIDGFSTAERVPSERNVELYRFTFSHKSQPVWVAWLDDGRVRGPGAQRCSGKVVLSTVKTPVTVTRIPTGETEAAVKQGRTDGAVVIEMDETPLIIEMSSTSLQKKASLMTTFSPVLTRQIFSLL
ncbi:MAG: beta-galactosidase [Vulcanimicrobiota bacterium]